MTELREAMARSISRRVAKREFGEHYQGYETSHGDAGGDYADAALAAIEAAGWQCVPKVDDMSGALVTNVRRGIIRHFAGRVLSDEEWKVANEALEILVEAVAAAPKP